MTVASDSGASAPPPDVWLIVVSAVVSALLLVMSFVMLVYFSHPDDKNTAYVPKVFVVLSMTIAEVMVLLTALDVSNRAGIPGCGIPSYPFNITLQVLSGSPTAAPTQAPTRVNVTTPVYPAFSGPTGTCSGGLDTATMWSVMFFLVALLVALILPFNIFFYESNEAGRKVSSRICEAIQYQGIALVAAGLTLGIMYWQINTYTYPIITVPFDVSTNLPSATCNPGDVVQGCTGQYFDPTATIILAGSPAQGYSEVKQKINNVPNSFGVYLASFLSFVGWWLFCIYTGVGLIATPIDLIRGFLYRPKYIPKDIYIKLREDIRQRLEALVKLGMDMKAQRKKYEENYSNLGYSDRYRKGNSQKTAFRDYKRNVEQLEADYEDLRICHEAWTTYNPLIPYVKLLTGIFCVIFSVCWILQIVLFIFPQYWPGGFSYVPTYFLNDFITWGLIYSGFSLLGVIFIAVFGLYLFVCNVNGNFKIGLRFLIMDIHPMKVGGTYMSSFLVNMILLLLQAPALINFIALAFSNSFVLTDIDTIMNQIVRYTTFFIYFFDNNVFVWLLLAFVILSMCLVYALPDQGKISAKRLKKRMEKMQSAVEDREKEATRGTVKGIGLKDITRRVKEAADKKDGKTGEGEGDDDGDIAVA